jgi:F-type H+-transporting ATPase subunit a
VTTGFLSYAAAEGGSSISPSEHVGQFEFLGMTFNGDTMWTSTIAALIVVGAGLYVRSRVTSGVPNKVQMAYEALTGYMVDQVQGRMGRRPAEYLAPLTIALFAFILFSNWLGVIPSGHPEFLKPPTSDVNVAYALAIFVFVSAWVWGFREQGAGTLSRFTKPYVALLPLNLIEEIAKPISLSLRLFGNILSGTIMISVIALIPWWGLWLPNAAWKLFDLFIGAIQALIFALLTIMQFFSPAVSEEGH